jgi:hypothetical protein
LGRADTYDIGVKLYTDLNCLFAAETFTLLDNGCYGNIWASNASAKGFKMTIIDFGSPPKFDLRQYSDDCHIPSNPSQPKTTISGDSNACPSSWAQCTPHLTSVCDPVLARDNYALI